MQNSHEQNGLSRTCVWAMPRGGRGAEPTLWAERGCQSLCYSSSSRAKAWLDFWCCCCQHRYSLQLQRAHVTAIFLLATSFWTADKKTVTGGLNVICCLPLIQAVSEVGDQTKPRMDDECEMNFYIFGLHGGIWVVTLDQELCQVNSWHRHMKGNILLCIWLMWAESMRKKLWWCR